MEKSALIFSALISSALLNACVHLPTAMRADVSTFSTQENIRQGEYEEFYFPTKNYRGTRIDFKIHDRRPGKWLPLLSLGLSDQSLQQRLDIRLMLEQSGTSVEVMILNGSETLFSNSQDLSSLPESMELSWSGREVSIKLADKDWTMLVPFDIAFVRHSASSVALTRHINNTAKEDDEKQ